MIYVSQGHEKGIGLEVFFKSFICLDFTYQKQFLLIISKSDLEDNLNKLKIKFNIFSNSLELASCILNCHFFEPDILPNSTRSLDLAVGFCKPNDILLTLPTSKDQLFYNDKQVNGHTEYFRKKFNCEEIAMSFLGEDSNFLLLSDHIAIEEVPKYLSIEFIVKKVSITIQGFVNQRNLKDIYFSGLNPHCGESGQISSDDLMIFEAIEKLKILFPDLNFHEAQPGDTIHFNIKDRSQLFVYAFHDQGLAPFKLKYGLTGINFSVGLPFKRVSVDHGTAFSLFGKNKANYIGMLYLLKEIKNWT